MIDQFVEEAKKEIGLKISERFQLDAEQMTTLFRIAKNTLQDQVKIYFFKSKIQEIVDLFTKDNLNSILVNETKNNFKKNIQNQMNFSEEKSLEISNALVPLIIHFFKDKFLSSGKTHDIAGLSSFLGLGGISSIFSMFSKK